MHRVTVQRDPKQDVLAQQSGPREFFKERQLLDGVSFAQVADLGVGNGSIHGH